MITTTSTAASGDRPVGPHGHATEDAGVTGHPAGFAYWIDPGNGDGGAVQLDEGRRRPQ